MPTAAAPRQYRQGDVLVTPAGHLFCAMFRAKRDRRGRLVLAEGETTGHAHAVAAPDAELLLDPLSERRFLRVPTEAPLTHEEHAAIPIAPGLYEVRRQREYTPSAITFVAD